MPAPYHLQQVLVDAVNHHRAGRAAEAELLYRSALHSPRTHALASYGLGLLCATQGRLREATANYRDAIAAQPDFADAHINLGTTLLSLGQCQEAMEQYRQAIAINPDNAMAHSNLGKVLQDLGRSDEAIAEYRIAVALQPDDANINVNYGAALLERQLWDDAVTIMRRAIASQPDNALAHANLGTALMQLGRHDEALQACRQAMSLQLQGATIHASLGGAMLELGAWSEAIELCRRAVVLDPMCASAHFNLSHALKATNRLDEAERAARAAIAVCPDLAEYHFHLAHVLLSRGDLAAGWPEYDWRWKLRDFAWISDLHGEFKPPLWTGEDISDKTLLVYTEQGLGDMILFARYLPMAVLRARHVILAASPRIRRLLGTIEGVTTVSVRQVPLPDFDVHCPLLSLPRAFGTRLDTIPAPVRYLRAEPAAQASWSKLIERRRSGSAGLLVGIVWAGNPATKRDHFRSPGLAAVIPLFSVPGVDFVVLQMGEGRQDLSACPLPQHVLDMGNEVTDLADTAAIISALDLMISSCTAPLHLAAALGVPTWAMIQFAPYFPWLLECSVSPWYPSVRLYRQGCPGRDWSGVVARIATDLAELAQSRSGHPPQSQSDHTASIARTTERSGVSNIPAEALPSHTAGSNELAACRSGLMLFNRNDTYIGASLRKYGEFSAEEVDLFRIIVQPGRTVLDIGANIGAHTVELSRLVGAVGKVFAFEPQRLTFQLLCANVALNSCANVFAQQMAIGAAAGVILVPVLDPDQNNNFGGLTLLGSTTGEAVPLVTIDSLALHDCQFIKLDIEGMETEALRGCNRTIERFRPFLYVENDRPERSAELIGLLLQYGYRLYWHLPPLYRVNNYRSDPEDIFGNKVSVNMIGIPAELPQSPLTNLREVSGPTDSMVQW